MNFFEQQEQARRRTRTLIILFLCAVVAILIAVNLATVAIWALSRGGYSSDPGFYPQAFFAPNTLVTLGLIACLLVISDPLGRDSREATIMCSYPPPHQYW